MALTFVENVKSHAKVLKRAMFRSKPLPSSNVETNLKRCLTAFDLTLLGIGNMAGSGLYVLTGTVVRDKAGPATFISYFIAGLTAFLNAVCYAELGSRIPISGSAYSYTYIASGEILAFIIGWSVILEYILSVASVARGWSGIIDSMSHHAIKNFTINTFGSFPKEAEFLGEYPDFLGGLFVLFLGLILSRGPKISVRLNSSVTILNLCVIILTACLMFSHVTQTGSAFAPETHGGFIPHGVGALIAGAGTCFYAFIGFDSITVSCEEALDPRKALPIATAASVGTVSIIFVISSLSLVLFVPWWSVDRSAAFTAAFHARGIHWAAYVTGAGSILGLSASLFTSMYALPRVVYAMASDGLLPSQLGYLMPSTKVPIVALSIFGSMSGILTFLCDIHTLADFLSIGTLIAYTIACVNVCILRYFHPDIFESKDKHSLTDDSAKTPIYEVNESDFSQWSGSIGKLKSAFKHLPILKDSKPGYAPLYSLVLYIIAATIVVAIILPGNYLLAEGSGMTIFILICAIVVALISIFVMVIHEQNMEFETFKGQHTEHYHFVYSATESIHEN